MAATRSPPTLTAASATRCTTALMARAYRVIMRASMELPDYVGRFRVLDLVGEGAMGVVYRGRDQSLDRDVALKVMRAKSAEPEDRERFLREARSVARLQHPNIITVYELGDHDGAPFIAMELLEGVDLQRAIEGGLRPNPRVTLPIVLQLLAGLGHAHEHGIVHRDIKPSNLFLPRGRPAKIMDFGVARLGGSTSSAGMMVGTPNYMSPEQVQAQPVDSRTDLFSAGLILYELVTGERAYQGDTVVALVYQIAHEDPDLGLIPKGPQWERLRAVLVRALAKHPDQRYDTAERMGGDLAAALQDLGGSIDGAAASDKGLVNRGARTSPTGRRDDEAATEPAPIPPAARVEATAAEHAAPPAPPPRPRWLAPAIGGVAVLVAAAATLVAMLVWPRGEGGGDTAARSPEPAPSASAESLLSAAAALHGSATATGTATVARRAPRQARRPPRPRGWSVRATSTRAATTRRRWRRPGRRCAGSPATRRRSPWSRTSRSTWSSNSASSRRARPCGAATAKALSRRSGRGWP
ncbi:MAG: hypothetical protein DMF78_10990 [Acidobacteria bacterium]|nr:MAG: hypothetical protein DMF78_10990 [Acidobacteriota bacterium]